MNRDEFGYWLKGLMASGESLQAIVNAVLYKAGEVAGTPARSNPPVGLQPLAVPQFCIHNVALREPCAGCVIEGERFFAFSLPKATPHVYIRSDEQRTHPPAGGAPAATTDALAAGAVGLARAPPGR